MRPTCYARQGNNISKIKDATGVQIHFPRPEAKENPDLIMCSGPKDGVQQAVDQINDLVKKIQNFTEIKYKVRLLCIALCTALAPMPLQCDHAPCRPICIYLMS
jgi:hypothetical protein